MSHSLRFSLIVPTRQRTEKLRRFLDSLAATTADIRRIEVVLVIDADDSDSRSFHFDRDFLRKVIVDPGLPMGALNQAGYEACSGDFIMLMNDDVIVKTRKWDRRVSSCLRRYPDGIVLIHVNDTLFQEGMCTFPLVSRTYCELAGGICPTDYLRYRIDDHVEQVFNLLGVLGERRIAYLPDVIFEHDKFIETRAGERKYYLDERLELLDEPRFAGYFEARKELALRLRRHITGRRDQPVDEECRSSLKSIENSQALRPVGRYRHESPTRRLLSGARRRLSELFQAREECRRRQPSPEHLTPGYAPARIKPLS
jgi:glycosyltransferase involved in cell wall biosynthesis